MWLVVRLLLYVYKKLKNVKGCRDVHESKGQRIGKAPSLHLFHTTVTQCMGKRITSSLAVGGCSSFSSHFLAWDRTRL